MALHSSSETVRTRSTYCTRMAKLHCAIALVRDVVRNKGFSFQQVKEVAGGWKPLAKAVGGWAPLAKEMGGWGQLAKNAGGWIALGKEVGGARALASQMGSTWPETKFFGFTPSSAPTQFQARSA
jgi:hypothetical protein